MQATSSATVLSYDDNTMEFEIKDHFAPTQKNEIQLQFKKTCADPGRKPNQHNYYEVCYGNTYCITYIGKLTWQLWKVV